LQIRRKAGPAFKDTSAFWAWQPLQSRSDRKKKAERLIAPQPARFSRRPPPNFCETLETFGASLFVKEGSEIEK